MSAESEARVLEVLRDRYERAGYTFAHHPDGEPLPQFMAGYLPYAIARKGDLSIAIEVKSRKITPQANRLKDLAARFNGHPDWQLHVVYADELEQETAPAPDRSEILARLTAIEVMAANDNRDAALVLAWAALEATARVIAKEALEELPQTPREALQVLEHLGRIDYPTAQAIRRSLNLRNQVVHGDFTATVPPAIISNLVGTVRAALAA